MKKSLLSILFVAAFGFMSNAQTETLLFSDDFESYTVGTDITTIQPTGAIGNYEPRKNINTGVIDANGNPGNCVKMTNDGNKRGFLRIPLDSAILSIKDYSYRLTADVKNAANTASLYVGVEFYDADGNRYRMNSIRRDQSSDWVTDTILFAPDTVVYDTDTHVTELYLYVYISGDPDGGSYDSYIDNISFVRIGDGPTKINKNMAYKVDLYPNPSNGLFRLNSEKPIKEYKVYNTVGQAIKEVKGVNSMMTNIDLTGSNKGVYLVKVFYENGDTQVVRALLK